MTDDKFFERLREDADQLRFDGGDVMATRIAARVRERITGDAQSGVAQVLARWFRPVGAALATLALVATLGVTWLEESRDNSGETLDAVTSTQTVDVSLAGDFSVE